MMNRPYISTQPSHWNPADTSHLSPGVGLHPLLWVALHPHQRRLDVWGFYGKFQLDSDASVQPAPWCWNTEINFGRYSIHGAYRSKNPPFGGIYKVTCCIVFGDGPPANPSKPTINLACNDQGGKHPWSYVIFSHSHWIPIIQQAYMNHERDEQGI